MPASRLAVNSRVRLFRDSGRSTKKPTDNVRIQGAVIREQGVVFAIVVVKPFVTQSSHEAEKARNAFQPAFPGLPLVLASQGAGGRFTYHGRTDLARFLSRISASRIPWKEYSYAC